MVRRRGGLHAGTWQPGWRGACSCTAACRGRLGLPQETTEDQGLAMQEVFQEMDVDESGGVGFAELAKFVRRVKTARAAGAVSSGDGH